MSNEQEPRNIQPAISSARHEKIVYAVLVVLLFSSICLSLLYSAFFVFPAIFFISTLLFRQEVKIDENIEEEPQEEKEPYLERFERIKDKAYWKIISEDKSEGPVQIPSLKAIQKEEKIFINWQKEQENRKISFSTRLKIIAWYLFDFSLAILEFVSGFLKMLDKVSTILFKIGKALFSPWIVLNRGDNLKVQKEYLTKLFLFNLPFMIGAFLFFKLPAILILSIMIPIMIGAYFPYKYLNIKEICKKARESGKMSEKIELGVSNPLQNTSYCALKKEEEQKVNDKENENKFAPKMMSMGSGK